MTYDFIVASFCGRKRGFFISEEYPKKNRKQAEPAYECF
jgi:hypothetical protein